MILQIDVGNSQTKWRLVDGTEIRSRGSQHTQSLLDGPLILGDINTPSSAQLCSVADSSIELRIGCQITDQYGIRVQIAKVSPRVGQVTCGYQEPKSLGIDRWLAIVAAYHQDRCASLVVDVGSAMTIDLIGPDGQHQGGYILPGIQLMRQSLWRGTDQVKVDAIAVTNVLVPGMHTADAVNKGCLLAAVAAVEKLASEYPAAIVVTGGDALALIDTLSLKAKHSPDLVLEGLSVGGIAMLSYGSAV